MEHRRIIKQGQIILATGEDGSIDPASAASQGLFLADTRFLSRFEVRVNGQCPLFLGSTEEIKFEASFLLTTPEVGDVPAHGVGLLQHNSISGGKVSIALTVANWALRPVNVELSVLVDADFFDSFETRGIKRLERGKCGPPDVSEDGVCLDYMGLDRVRRSTRISTSSPMSRFTDGRMCFDLRLGTNTRRTITLDIELSEEDTTDQKRERKMIDSKPKPPWFSQSSRATTSNVMVNSIVARSQDDLEVLLNEYDQGWVPVAGLPRFGVPFGRDCLITGIETLAWNPTMSRDILRFLAARQGQVENPWTYEQPGKIMHEMHTGELARLEEIPFGRFYGSVDSTVLFLVLAAEYIRWTADVSIFRELRPNLEAAWKWVDEYGDIDGSGYIQYEAHSAPEDSRRALKVGLFNQGWKDSARAVMYSSGEIVTDHPIALAEVQGELYRALDLWGGLYQQMPESDAMPEKGAELKERAAKLKERFNRDFWMPEKQFYAMALDGHHRHVDSITSNPGQCLWSRIVDDERAPLVAKRLMEHDMFSEWGIRTMGNREEAYNPFSYHDGSVWPFDNAIIASGLKKYGLVSETQRVFESLIDASHYFEYERWPEVYCGVGKDISGVLARQPNACRPQAWSAGAIFLLGQTLLGMAPRAFSHYVDITPVLPTSIDEIKVENVPIAGSYLSLRVVREGSSVLMEIMDNPGGLDILIHPATRVDESMRGEDMPAFSR